MADPVYRALLIGNSTFPHDPSNLQTLEGPVNDIALLRDALTDPATGLFDRHDVRLVPERTMSELLLELERFFATASRADCLLLFYSGHGLLTTSNQLMLAARDTRTDSLLATTVSASAINAMIEASPAQTTVIVLDCCYSGAFKGSDLPRSLAGSGRYLLTSTRSGQLAQDADRRNATSFFTTHLVEGLQAGAPDRDGDGYVDLDDLYEYVHRRLAETGRQIPQRTFAGGGDVMVARRAPVRSAPSTVALPAAGGRKSGGPVRGPSSAGGHPGPPAPAEASPVLDVSETVIDLGDVGPDEVLPIERVAVLNRGGGRLDWVAVSDADWLTVGRDGEDVRIELHPRPGTNRGTVLVRDRGPGGARTIRVRVTVLPREARGHGARVVGDDGADRPWWQRPASWALAGLTLAAAVLTAVVPRLSDGGGADGAAGGAEGGEPEVTAVTVDGARDWTDTGVDVRAGDRVTVVAEGEIFHSATKSTGPAGFPNRPDLRTPFPELNHAALIGQFGEGADIVFVGERATGTAQTDGPILLGINDGGLENNRGSFETTITVEPGTD